MPGRCVLVAAVVAAGCGERIPERSSFESSRGQALGKSAFECDAPSGTRATWSRAIDPAGGMATGSLYLAGGTGFRVPYAQVKLDGGGGPDDPRAGFNIFRRIDATTANVWVINGTGEKGTQLNDPDDVTLDRLIRFALRWHGFDVQVRFEPGGQWTTIPVAFAPRRLSLLCSSAVVLFHSVTVEPAAGDVDFDCEARAGKLSSWSRAVEPEQGVVTGSIVIAQMRDEGWPPSARVLLGLDDDPAETEGFTISVSKGDESFHAELFDTRAGVHVVRELAPIPFGKTIPFSVRWKDSAEIKLGADGPWLPLPAPAVRPKRLWLRCGSAEAKFSGVKVVTSARNLKDPR